MVRRLGERQAGGLRTLMKLRMPEMPPATLVAALGSYNLLPAIVFLPTRRRCDEAASEAALSRRSVKRRSYRSPARLHAQLCRAASRDSQTPSLGHDRARRDRLASRGPHAGVEAGD